MIFGAVANAFAKPAKDALDLLLKAFPSLSLISPAGRGDLRREHRSEAN